MFDKKIDKYKDDLIAQDEEEASAIESDWKFAAMVLDRLANTKTKSSHSLFFSPLLFTVPFPSVWDQ